ncbi:MAG: pantetheine-phosphate adenylyltransferase [Gammaproteobacteria bacterium]
MPTIVYPGSFDPITLGHVDLVERAARLCERVVVAVGSNPGKSPMFSVDKRVVLAEHAVAHVPQAEVVPFSGLLVDFVRSVGGDMVLRGLRAVSDFEFEFQLASMNRRLAPEIETLFLTPAENLSFVSSSLVKEVARLGGDVKAFVPKSVQDALSVRDFQ